MQDLIDIGFGYDETDPFIDNSEAVSSPYFVNHEVIFHWFHWLPRMSFSGPQMLPLVFMITFHVVFFFSPCCLLICLTFPSCHSLTYFVDEVIATLRFNYLFPVLMFPYSTFSGPSKDGHLSLLAANLSCSQIIPVTHEYVCAPWVHTGICHCFCLTVLCNESISLRVWL